MSIKAVFPLILPPKCFIDRFNSVNSYMDMNPSMWIDNGKVMILVRSVNYRKFLNKHFTIYETHSNSIYQLIRCDVSNWNDITCEDIIVENMLPTYPTYWLGLEDIRFITSTELLVTIPSCNKNGNPSIFKARLEGNKIHSFSECYPNHIEKNWMPFYNNSKGCHQVIYSLTPFIIKSIDIDDCTTIGTIKTLEGFHGSTNGIEFRDGILFLVHITSDKVYHKWILFHPLTNEIKVSEQFVFFNYSYIEFTCSLAKYNDRLFVSIGVNDDKAFIIEVNHDTITF
jgi:hypothetical protein